MRYLCSVVFCLLLWNSLGYAQTDTLGMASGLSGQTAKMEEFLSKLQIYQDRRITDLLVRHSQINQRKQVIDGYRLEIFFSSESSARQQSVRVRNEFNLVFPTIPSYMLFQTPNFKVRIGDFRNKSEALKIKAYIESKYPNAYIVKDNIRYPEIFTEPLDQPEEQ
jgi:hypothetical protein